MCGIVGAVAERNVVPILMEGLRRLEYRGYDSAGIAVSGPRQGLSRERTQGKVADLAKLLADSSLQGCVGIAHTRWATHGVPSVSNAHPHVCHGSIAIVHNGIIENHAVLRAEQSKRGYKFTSDTDTEVVVHQIHRYTTQGLDLLAAVQASSGDLEGAYALGVISKEEPGRLIAARRGSPLVIGIGVGEHFIASDISALLPVTHRFIILEDGDFADLKGIELRIYDASGALVERPVTESQLSADAADRGSYRHYMLKEIHEQPHAIADTLEGRITEACLLEGICGPDAPAIFERIRAIKIIACGTSFHAGLIAQHWFETLAKMPCSVEVASEFRYREPVASADTLIVIISQSGETADSLAALYGARERGFGPSLGIVNVPESSLVREADLVLMTRAGTEIGVASTKAFTTQLVALLLLVLAIGKHHGLKPELEAAVVAELRDLPGRCGKALALDRKIRELAEAFADKEHALFLGRGLHYPVAMEGALKLKEISYIHAEAYPAGELKHGPLALVDAEMPVVAVAPNDALLEKLKSNLEEVRARGGQLYVFADAKAEFVATDNVSVMNVPSVGETVAPILYTIPLQLLAYHVAVLKGTDVDQPRNLAKSVTVE